MAFDDVSGVATDRDDRIRLDDVTVRRRGAALIDRLTLTLGPRGVTALLGPNGAGKSLTLRLIMGLITPDHGSVTAPRPAALAPQRPALLRRSVRSVLAHAAAAAGVGRRERTERIDALMAETRIAALADRPAAALSGGERARVALARALTASPKLLLIDEPTAHLDPSAAALFETLVQELRAKGLRMIIATHDAAQARRLADDVAFLNRGRLDAQAAAEPFFAEPPSPAARAYLAGDLLT